MLSEDANKRFCDEVVRRLQHNPKLGCMEIILELAEENGIDPAAAGRMLNETLRQVVQAEANSMHFRTVKGPSLPLK
mgnify:CR=1 FL=1